MAHFSNILHGTNKREIPQTIFLLGHFQVGIRILPSPQIFKSSFYIIGNLGENLNVK